MFPVIPTHGLQVRSEFDQILLQHAAESGARVWEGVQITSVNFSAADSGKPVSAEWKSDRGDKGSVAFKWLVDASGRAGLLSTKYLKNRKFNPALRNIAFWAYWTGVGTYQPGKRPGNSPWFEALTGEWAGHIR
jgi:flavin-dependent dehydrogenase